MPNGVDRNYVRLAIATAVFKRVYGVWPTQARVAPRILWNYAQLFDADNFELLCAKLRLRTTSRALIVVGDDHHHLDYDKMPPHDHDLDVREASDWLGSRVRPELGHFE